MYTHSKNSEVIMKIWIVLFSAGILTFLMRYLPMNSPFFHKMSFLKHEAFAVLPLCVLAALIGPDLLPWQNAPLSLCLSLALGTICTLVTIRKTDSTLGGAFLGV